MALGQVAHQEEPTEHDSGHAEEVDQDVVLWEVRRREVWESAGKHTGL